MTYYHTLHLVKTQLIGVIGCQGEYWLFMYFHDNNTYLIAQDVRYNQATPTSPGFMPVVISDFPKGDDESSNRISHVIPYWVRTNSGATRDFTKRYETV